MRVAFVAIAFVWASAAGAEVFYRLPWPDGLSFMFTQASGGRITTHFTKATLHAVDVAMPEGVPVLAARAGTVEAAPAHHGADPDEEPLTYEGNFVRVRHADGSAATYAHLRYQGVAVTPGETIEVAQLLGYSGATGDVIQPHLHFVVTRTQLNASGWREELSVPATFYVGIPAIPFAPRAAMIATANYSREATPPYLPSDGGPHLLRKRAVLEAADETRAWGLLAVWIACGIAGMAGFWAFSRGA
jgi:murein DD-endopeptidase MepM/ murein hydrolase activator NlpD